MYRLKIYKLKNMSEENNPYLLALGVTVITNTILELEI
jgi:hypothetical protein